MLMSEDFKNIHLELVITIALMTNKLLRPFFDDLRL